VQKEELVISVVLVTALLVFLVIIIFELLRGVILTRQGYGVKKYDEPNKFWKNMVGQILLFLFLTVIFFAAIIVSVSGRQ